MDTKPGNTVEIVKAKIAGKKWEITHERAKRVYQDRRGPKRKIEKAWPRKQRSMFCRLRTGHCKQLQNFQHNKLGKGESALCPKCEEGDETIEHIICTCPSLEARRFGIKVGEWEESDMVRKPLECMELLQHRFPEELKITLPAAQTTEQ